MIHRNTHLALLSAEYGCHQLLQEIYQNPFLLGQTTDSQCLQEHKLQMIGMLDQVLVFQATHKTSRHYRVLPHFRRCLKLIWRDAQTSNYPPHSRPGRIPHNDSFQLAANSQGQKRTPRLSQSQRQIKP